LNQINQEMRMQKLLNCTLSIDQK